MAQAISILGVHYATISDFLVGERDNDYGGVGPILEIPRGVVPAFTGNLQFRYGSATKYTFRAVAGDECVGNVTAGNLANIAIIDGGGFNLDFRNENIHFENIYVHNFTLTTTGDSYDGLSFKGGVVDCYFYLKNSASTLGVSTDNTTIVLGSGDPEPEVDKVVDISGSVPFHGLNSTVINKAGGVSGATGVIYNRSSAVSTFNYVCVFSATNPSYVASGAGVPTGANNCAHDALMPGSVSSGVTAADFMDLANGDYRIKGESVPGLLGIGAHIQPIVNIDPELVTPAPDLSFVTGTTGSYDTTPHFTDQNIGDVLTYSSDPEMTNGCTYDSVTGVISCDVTAVVSGPVSYTLSASDGHGGVVSDVITIEITPVVPVINSINGGSPIRVGQTGIGVNCDALDVSPAIQVAKLNGKSLIVTDWNSGDPIVDVPADINLIGGRTYQLSITDDNRTVTLDNVLLNVRAGWNNAVFNGVLSDTVETDSVPEMVLTDALVNNFDMKVNDVFVYEEGPGLSFNDSLQWKIEPPVTLTRKFKIWDESESTFTVESTFTITDGGVPPDTDAPIFISGPTLSNVTETTLTVGFATNENGNYRMVIVSDGAVAPIDDEVLAGTGNAGAVAVFATSLLSMTENVGVSIPVTGLTGNTSYDMYICSVDGDGNKKLSSRIDVTTVDPNAPAPLVKKVKVTGVVRTVNGASVLVTQNFSHYYLTKSNIDMNNKAGIAIDVDASGEGLQITAGSGEMITPETIVNDEYTLVAFEPGLSGNDHTHYFRGVNLLAVEE